MVECPTESFHTAFSHVCSDEWREIFTKQFCKNKCRKMNLWIACDVCKHVVYFRAAYSLMWYLRSSKQVSTLPDTAAVLIKAIRLSAGWFHNSSKFNYSTITQVWITELSKYSNPRGWCVYVNPYITTEMSVGRFYKLIICNEEVCVGFISQGRTLEWYCPWCCL